jgi:hypothetical protein
MLAPVDSEPVRERIPALVYRAKFAMAVNDPETASKRLAELRELPLRAADRVTLVAVLERANAIEADARR